MAGMPVIKRRIRSVTNTRQITRAMQLVASRQLVHSQTAAAGPAAYTEAAWRLISELGAQAEAAHHPLFEARPVQRELIILIGGDRGLAGAYYGNLSRALATREPAPPARLVIVGRHKLSLRAAHGLTRVPDLQYEIEATNPDTGIAQPLAALALNEFLAERADAVRIITTRFHSPVSQKIETSVLLPFPRAAAAPATDYEPGPLAVLEAAAARALEARLLQSILEAKASEEASRMMAMIQATDNAGDLIDHLTLSFNQARQAAITQEIAEVSVGADATKDAEGTV